MNARKKLSQVCLNYKNNRENKISYQWLKFEEEIMKNKIGFLDSRLGSDTEVWRNEIRAYESQHIEKSML